MIAAAIAALAGVIIGWGLKDRDVRKRWFAPRVILRRRDFEALAGHARVGAAVAGARSRVVYRGGEALPDNDTEADRVDATIEQAQGTWARKA